jgi:hypothetical protein
MGRFALRNRYRHFDNPTIAAADQATEVTHSFVLEFEHLLNLNDIAAAIYVSISRTQHLKSPLFGPPKGSAAKVPIAIKTQIGSAGRIERAITTTATLNPSAFAASAASIGALICGLCGSSS